MHRMLCTGFLGLLVVLSLATGCRKAPNPPQSTGLFSTSFQTESQFVVEAIVSDLAEQMYYAVHHRLPEGNAFSVTAVEKFGSPMDAPRFDLEINLDQAIAGLKAELDVKGPIWSPDIYRGVADTLANAIGLRGGTASGADDTGLISDLLDMRPETLLRANEAVSSALQQDFGDASLHEQAALLLGAFANRDESGNFGDTRSPLSRITAHLLMAQFLHGGRAYGVNGRLAEALLLTQMGNRGPAVDALAAIHSDEEAVTRMVRALTTQNTGDYRALSKVTDRSPIEAFCWFFAWADYVSPAIAWNKLTALQKTTVDYVRSANEMSYSVEMGHQLLQTAIPLELQEISTVYETLHGEALNPEDLVEALNAVPERCFGRGPEGDLRVHVIGWGQWANFLQQHLCHAVQKNFDFMYHKWGVPDEAEKFAAANDARLAGLRLYPFVQRINCTNEKAYHDSVDAAYEVIEATPHLVPAQCWNYVWYRARVGPYYSPKPSPLINEWFTHDPLPGTVYTIGSRMDHPNLGRRFDAVERFQELHQLAPYHVGISSFIIEHRDDNRPTHEQAMELFEPVLPYCVYALRVLAGTVYDEPEKYRGYMLQAAELNPSSYYTLGNYFRERGEDHEAAQYYDLACDLEPDAVRIANNAEWRVRYYLENGDSDKARDIAEFAAEVYSYRGLSAMAAYYEGTTNEVSAFEWYARIEDRYQDASPLIAFCLRYKERTGDTRFDAEVEKRVKSMFPRGMEKVVLADFHAAPSDGVLIRGENERILDAGLAIGDVIVALNGVRVQSFSQYVYVRGLTPTSDLDLVVWKGTRYLKIRANPPEQRFGVKFVDFKAD